MVLVELDEGNKYPTSHEKHLLLPLFMMTTRRKILLSHHSKILPEIRVDRGSVRTEATSSPRLHSMTGN